MSHGGKIMHHYLDCLPTRPTRWTMALACFALLAPFILAVGGLLPVYVFGASAALLMAISFALKYFQSPEKKTAGRAQAAAEIQAARNYVAGHWTQYRAGSVRDLYRATGTMSKLSILRQAARRTTGSGRQRRGAAGRKAQAKTGNNDSDGGGGEPPHQFHTDTPTTTSRNTASQGQSLHRVPTPLGPKNAPDVALSAPHCSPVIPCIARVVGKGGA